MKVLFIAPLPPPTNGQSLAAETFLKRLATRHEVRIVNMAKVRPMTLWLKVKRSFEVVHILADTFRQRKGIDVVYLTVSESIFGNIKDLIIYLICYRHLKVMFIHMLGGAGMKKIIEQGGVQSALNRFFMKQLRGVIVEGQAQAATFSAVVPAGRIHVIPNFAEESLFVTEDDVRRKFGKMQPLNILFLSNLIYGKGHQELADAYISLDDDMKANVNIVFVGGFESAKDKDIFLNKIKEERGLIYYSSFVSGDEKKALYCKAHIFCLPTYYPYEGQPISILEAYATGCVVITTKHSGIPDVFCNRVNGFFVEKRSANAIKFVIEDMVHNQDGLLNTALANRKIALEKYRTSIFASAMMKVIENDSH